MKWVVPLSLDLRKRIVAHYQKGQTTYVETAVLFGVGEASVSRLLRRARERDSLESELAGGGFPPRIRAEDYPQLLEVVATHPDSTVAEICDIWKKLKSVTVSESSMKRAFYRVGLTRKKKRSLQANKSDQMCKKSGERSFKM